MTTTRTIRMSYDNFEDAIVSFLYSVGVIADDEEVVASDFGIEVDNDGQIEFDIDVVQLKGN